MDRQYYLDLASRGLRMPIAADLVLHENPEPSAIVLDGDRLGQVVIETARRFKTPLAIPHMDLALEKHAILTLLDVPAEDQARFHFSEPPGAAILERFLGRLHGPLYHPLQAHTDSVAVAATQRDLLPIGMSIGPFSLLTKLVSDPITPIAMAGAGMTADDDPEIDTIEQVLEIAIRFVLRSIEEQIRSGAKAILIADPAANKVYFSPNQLENGSDIFERYAMSGMRRVKALLDAHGVDLLFHCCGELVDAMVSAFVSLDPAILSLGSSRRLWDDAALVPRTTVLYGNLPSKSFYSDDLITREQVISTSEDLIQKMKDVGHPFILGSECDVLSVSGCHQTIYDKVVALAEG